MNNNEASMDNFFNTLFGNVATSIHTPIYSESDIISMYIDGRITKEEYIKMMDSRRNR